MGAAAENVTNGHAKQDVQCAAQTILGDERYELVRNAKLLVVGAGGIGCELLKNLVMTGFRDIEVIDLDTIDVSNLNRQFLFRRCHVDQPKSTVAAEAVKNFRPADPHLKIVAHHGNIKAQEYSSEWFGKFDAVLNALDNLEARRHVNRLCLAAERPLLEAGSTGHLGQVTVIKKGETECFECEAKPSQKVYPYCTIRSTPEKPVHCLVWAKNLFDLCFGPVDDSNLLSDLGEEMRQFRAQETVEGEQVGKKIFTHLFKTDVEKQAALEELWSEKRPPPTPLNFEEACTKAATSDGANAPADKAMLETQKVPTVAGDAKGFVAAVAKMYGEQRATLGERVFSKDDPVAMDFVHCAANLRMENYGIKRLSRWDAQSIAGSIIPAVASTNAIVAGLEVLQLLHVLSATAAGKPLSGKESSCRTVWVRYPEPSKKKILQPSTLRKPNPDCFVCGSCTGRVVVKSLEEWKIGAFVKACVQGALGAQRPNILLNGTCIYDPEYPEASPEAEEDGMHPEWSLAEWGLASGSVVQVEDEGQHFACNLILREDLGLSEELHPQGFHIEASVPDAAEQASAAKTRDAETGEPSPKRQATAADVQPAMVIDD